MKTMKKLGLLFSAIVFCLGIFVVSGSAQYRNERRWENNRRPTTGVYRNPYYNRNRRVSPRESYRLSRQRGRIYRTERRYQRSDGYIDKRESQRLDRLRDRYRRNYRRDRRDW